MVLIDTSVWISLFRKESHEVGQKMWSLTAGNLAGTCGQVWLEYIGGFRKEADRRRHAAAFKAFPFLETTREAYERAAEIVARHHLRLGPGDALVAATALTTHSPLFTLDRDFQVLVSEGLILY